MNANKTRLIKNSIAFILVILMGLGLVPLSAVTPTEDTAIPTADVSQRFPTNTPRPVFMLLSSDISAESVALSNELYNGFLGYDPELFLLTDEGIKDLGWSDVGTDEDLKYMEEIAYSIVADCSSTDEMIFAVTKYIARNIGYDHDYLNGKKEYTEMALNPWDVLEFGATVCEGYARTTAALLQILDIPCIYVLAPDHAWNMAYNGERWMLIDTTWISGSTFEDGILTKSDDLWLDWYDFTIEQANADANHTIQELAMSVVDGVLTKFPYFTKQTEVTIPASVHTIDTYVTYPGGIIETVHLPKSVTCIRETSFYFGETLETVYYGGSSADFSAIEMENWNQDLTECTDIRYLDEVSAPYITEHPADTFTAVGTSVTLSAGASCHSGTLTYQWYETTSRTNENGTPVAGAVTASLTIAPDTVGEIYYYLKATVTDPSCTGTDTKSAKTAPCQVRVFEEAPSSVKRIGPNAVMYVFDTANTVRMEGSGEVSVNWWDIPYQSTIYIDKDITAIADAGYSLGHSAKIVVEDGSSAYRSDDAGALYDLKESALLVLPEYSSATDYEVPEGTKIIAEDAINVPLTTLSLPGSLEVIEGSLAMPLYLTEITVSPDNQNFYIDSYGALIDKAGKRIVLYPGSASIISEYVVPDGIEYIEERAFMYADIRSIIFNDDLISIGDYAFFNSNYFSELEFPYSLKSIGSFAFKADYSLTDVYFRGNVPEEWGADVFTPYGDNEPVTIHYADTASGWSTPTWKHPDDTTTYTVLPFESGDIQVISIGAEYTVYKQVVTVKNAASACRVGYLANNGYIAVDAVKNTDGSYSFTVPEGIDSAYLVIIGDVNQDGKLDTTDAELLAHALLPSHFATHEDLTSAQIFAADINGNGKLNSADKTLLARSFLNESHAMHKALEW
ncbi:MAG: leucine-rich repeat protein [Clostridia bacterium]|nr:leucine-rich repeat protein [Clostridia bacterium]